MSSVTAEERYTQVLSGPIRAMGRASALDRGRRREMRSDVALVRVGPPLEWWPYRDVFEVDRQPVRDRDDRLARLFLEPAATARAQALRIEQESSRFNISNVGRVLNAPGLPLLFLQPEVRPRFHFALDRRDGGEGGGVWIVRYEERGWPTIFRHNRTMDNPSTGRLWVDAATGTVSRTEHVVSPEQLIVSFTTRFRHDDRFGVAVPVEMREQVSGGLQALRNLEGSARYDNFRRFEVSTEEHIRTEDAGRAP
jgi:hypothetical protein